MDQNDLEALLASLRSQQDAPAPAPPPAAAAPPQVPASSSSTAASAPPAPSQAELDALLASLTSLPEPRADAASTDSVLASTLSRTRDLTNLTFPESLPILHSLASDAKFLDKLEAAWDEQKNWELRMKDERNRLEQEAKRAGLSDQARSLKLKEWDRSTLKKWEKLQTLQQTNLQALGIPTFQPTRDPTILKRQERVMKVLVGFIEDRDDDGE
ncbi:hypothetical protein JCM10212_000246 [Sporobolomyces blumeae]